MTLAYHQGPGHEAPPGGTTCCGPASRGKVALYNSFYMSLYTFACMKADAGRQGRGRPTTW